MATFLIVFREALEAVLILGILVSVLRKTNQQALIRWVWTGAAAAVPTSLAGGWALYAFREAAESSGFGMLLEAAILYSSAALILYLVVWLGRVANPASALRAQVQAGGSRAALFGIAFTAILREGLESVVFLGTSMSEGGSGTNWAGAVAGLALALIIGWGIFVLGRQVPLQRIFRLSNITLILLAAGMAAYGTHELEEFLVDTHRMEELARAWDIFPKQKADQLPDPGVWYSCADGTCIHLLHDKGTVGAFFKTLLGYNSDPNYAEVALWALTLGLGIWLWRRPLPQQ